MPLIELVFWLVVPAGYATLVLMLGRWITRPFGLPPAVVALPLATAPIVALFRKEWRHSWIFMVPVAAAVLVAGRLGADSGWKEVGSAAFGTGVVWIPVMFVIGSVVGAVSRKRR